MRLLIHALISVKYLLVKGVPDNIKCQRIPKLYSFDRLKFIGTKTENTTFPGIRIL